MSPFFLINRKIHSRANCVIGGQFSLQNTKNLGRIRFFQEAIQSRTIQVSAQKQLRFNVKTFFGFQKFLSAKPTVSALLPNKSNEDEKKRPLQ